MRKFLFQVELIGVDIDEEMIRIGKTWFGLDDQRCSCLVDDGLAYLRRQVDEKSQFNHVFWGFQNSFCSNEFIDAFF